jgi:quercetin dioxygenase-like cupin family protein
MTAADGGLFVGPAEGKALTNPLGGRMVRKVSDRETGNAYSLHESVLPPASPGPRPHLHRNHEEAFYVLEGELTLRVGTRTITAPAGSFLLVPRGILHQPSNPSAQPTRVLLIFSPGGMDRFFEEAAERRIPLQEAPADMAAQTALMEFAARYGLEFAEFEPAP